MTQVFRAFLLALSLISNVRALLDLKNPLELFNKCISDHECKPAQFCDHNGVNPIGSCVPGYPLGQSCHFDRHCASKYCHNYKCVAKKPLRNGPCQKNQHQQCLPDQYCKNSFCADRMCSGWCTNRKYCMSNKCCMFRCTKPSKEMNEQFCQKTSDNVTTKKPLARDGPCSNENHEECLPSQYCSELRHHCADRKHEGKCLKHEHCLSNHCGLTFHCRKIE